MVGVNATVTVIARQAAGTGRAEAAAGGAATAGAAGALVAAGATEGAAAGAAAEAFCGVSGGATDGASIGCGLAAGSRPGTAAVAAGSCGCGGLAAGNNPGSDGAAAVDAAAAAVAAADAAGTRAAGRSPGSGVDAALRAVAFVVVAFPTAVALLPTTAAAATRTFVTPRPSGLGAGVNSTGMLVRGTMAACGTAASAGVEAPGSGAAAAVGIGICSKRRAPASATPGEKGGSGVKAGVLVGAKAGQEKSGEGWRRSLTQSSKKHMHRHTNLTHPSIQPSSSSPCKRRAESSSAVLRPALCNAEPLLRGARITCAM